MWHLIIYSSISEKLDSKIYSPCLSIGCVLELIPHYLIPKYGKGQFNIANHQKEKRKNIYNALYNFSSSHIDGSSQ